MARKYYRAEQQRHYPALPVQVERDHPVKDLHLHRFTCEKQREGIKINTVNVNFGSEFRNSANRRLFNGWFRISLIFGLIIIRVKW
jgi:hypothetical protein